MIHWRKLLLMNVLDEEFKDADQPPMKAALLLSITLSLNLAQAQMPAEIVTAERAKILASVQSVGP